MYSYSNEFIILPNKILRKNTKQYYKINKAVYEKCKNLFYTHFANFNLQNEFEEYMLKEKIVIDLDTSNEGEYYSPFVKQEGQINRVFVQLTNKCNLQCKHCYAESTPENPYAINKEHLLKFLSLAIENGVCNIDFTGGEIFTCSYLLDILKWIATKPVQVVLFSNLTLLSDVDIKILKELKCVRKIITSLDFFDPEKHNQFRNRKNAFQKTIENIKKLKDNNIEVTVNSIVFDDNHEEILKLTNYLVNELKVPVKLDNVIVEGRAAKGDVKIEQEKTNALVVATIMNQIEQKSELSLKTLNTLNDRWKNEFCGVGESMIFITAQENIALCPSLTDIKMDKKIAEVNSFTEIYNFLHKVAPLRCKEKHCPKYEQCANGCRARARTYTQDIYGRDLIYCYRLGVDELYENKK